MATFRGPKLKTHEPSLTSSSAQRGLICSALTWHRELYSLHEDAVVEGYTDVVMAHQFGVSNVVSILGTAMTEQHVKILRRFADRIVLLFDADEAGETAVNRAVELFMTQPVDFAVATMPDETDPDEFLMQRGAEAFTKLMKEIGELALAGRTKFHVICPALNSRLKTWTSDSDAAREAAQEREAAVPVTPRAWEGPRPAAERAPARSDAGRLSLPLARFPNEATAWV